MRERITTMVLAVLAAVAAVFMQKWNRYVRVPILLYMADPVTGLTEAVSTANAFIGMDNGGSPQGFDEIGEVVTIGGPNPDSEELDATHLRSPARTREYLQSFLVPGEVPLTVNFIPSNAATQHAQLMADYASGVTKAFRITYPDGSTDDFSAYVKNRPTSLNVGEVWRTQFTLRVTGVITFTPATGSPA